MEGEAEEVDYKAPAQEILFNIIKAYYNDDEEEIASQVKMFLQTMKALNENTNNNQNYFNFYTKHLVSNTRWRRQADEGLGQFLGPNLVCPVSQK